MADPNSVGNFLESLTTSMLSVLIGLIGFWTTFVRNMVTRKEVAEMISTHSPYVQDRQYILQRLESSKESQEKFSEALCKNTEVMNDLKVQIATLAQAIRTLEHKIYE
jgi:hypothetical protein